MDDLSLFVDLLGMAAGGDFKVGREYNFKSARPK
jgi:hypothetical protein